MLAISEAQVRESLSMPDAIDCMRQAFLDRAKGLVDHQPRRRVRQPLGMLHTLTAASASLELFGWKQYVTTRQGATFIVGLHDLSGQLIALIEADWLGRLRTGAVTAVAAQSLTSQTNATPGILALVGSGNQAHTQLMALHAAGLLSGCRVTSRTPSKAEMFAQQMAQELQLPVVAVASVEEAWEGAHYLVTATSAGEPLLPTKLPAGLQFLAAVGSNWPQRAELSPENVAQAGLVVCDDLTACQLEAGDLIQAVDAGTWNWDQARELADFVTPGPLVAPHDRGQPPALFKSVGLAFEDLYLAAEVYRRASAAG